MDKTPSLYSAITTRLTPISDTPALVASVLISHILNKPRTWVLAHPEMSLTPSQSDDLEYLVSRFEDGEPLPYILGHWEFFGMEFDVTADVLIPRPETELLVEKAIAWLTASPARRLVADIGTGSGVIATSIAVYIPDVNIIATDISPKALGIAKSNAKKFNVIDKIKFVQCNLLPAKSSIVKRQLPIDLICANLPYIPTRALHELPIYNREPTLALDGGEDGLEHIRKLLTIAPEWLARDGLILIEIEAAQGGKALSLAREVFPAAKIHLHRDLAGKDRLLSVNLSLINI